MNCTNYLVIKNVGECPIEGFTTLGLSSARGNSNMIGQFGSGSKHGVLTLLRMGINPVIYTGKTRISFHTEYAELKNGVTYNKVFAKIGQTKPRELSMCLEYGAIDWNQIDMGLREFVSNALDACNGQVGKISVKIEESIGPENGYTTVAIPVTPDVQRFYLELHNRFLQFSGRERFAVLTKDVPGAAKIFRKGVFVREAGSMLPSLFDYNFDDSVAIDEARNMDDYACQIAATCLIAVDKAALKDIFIAINEGKDSWEKSMGESYMLPIYAARNKELWLEAWTECFGKNAVAITDGAHMFMNSVEAKGYKPIIIRSSGWYDALVKAGIPTAFSVLDNVNDSGHTLYPATDVMTAKLNMVWDWVTLLGLTNGKNKPEIKGFRPMMEKEGKETAGYCKNSVVYIGMEYESSTKIMIEEVAHYVTGYHDCTREFQDYAFRLAGAILDV